MADIDPEDEPLFALAKANSVAEFDQRMADLITFATVFHVSDEVRRECEEELEAAKKNKYKL